jgi:hypothetical protein
MKVQYPKKMDLQEKNGLARKKSNLYGFTPAQEVRRTV